MQIPDVLKFLKKKINKIPHLGELIAAQVHQLQSAERLQRALLKMRKGVVLQHQQLQRRHIHEPIGGHSLQLVPVDSQLHQLGQAHELHGPDFVEPIPGQTQPAEFKAAADGGGRD